MNINALLLNKVTHKHLHFIETWVVNYMQQFDDDDPKIRENLDIKKTHTLKVRDEIHFLAKTIGLKEDALRLAEIIGLLHDMGRFNQYKKYRTFKDCDSEDHALLGLKLIEEQKLLNNFDHLAHNIIISAISYHNKIAIPQEEIDPFLTYEKLIRDADKLDIWRVVLEHYESKDKAKNEAIEWNYAKTGDASQNVLDDIFAKKPVVLEHVENMNDFKLLQMAWIFDLNYDASKNEAIKRDYLKKIYLTMPKTQNIDKVFNFLNSR